MVPINYYDLDCYGRLKFSALLRMVHIAADVNATELGIGYAQLAPLGLSFVLQRFSAAVCSGEGEWHLPEYSEEGELHLPKYSGEGGRQCLPAYDQAGERRLPAYGEEIELRTWPAAIERGLFIRKGAMYDINGRKRLEWASLWLLFDLNTRRILKASALPIEPDTLLQGDKGVGTAPDKVIIPADWSSWGCPHSTHTHTVRYADLDTNGHMNNAIYGDVVGNAAYAPSIKKEGNDGADPAPVPIVNTTPAPWTRLDINYLAETRPGDEIRVTARASDDPNCIKNVDNNEVFIIGEASSPGEATAPRRAFISRVFY